MKTASAEVISLRPMSSSSNLRSTNNAEQSDLHLANGDFLIQFRSLSYQLQPTRFQRLWNQWRNKSQSINRMVFSQLSGQLRAGQLTALVGPSGVGKSTLLECLAGARSEGRYRGQVRVIGNPQLDWAIIPQQDHFHEQLTARESVWFAYQLKNRHPRRLRRVEPVPIGRHPCETTVDRLLDQMQLNVSANTIVSDLSGGERKRLSIAQELTSNPCLLLLDEPTSSLDASASIQLLRLLRRLASSDSKMTILASIHQPSDRLLGHFDRLLALSFDGRCVFSGNPTILSDRLKRLQLSVVNESSTGKCLQNGDLLLEVAAGVHGANALNNLHTLQQQAEPAFGWPTMQPDKAGEWKLDLTQLDHHNEHFIGSKQTHLNTYQPVGCCQQFLQKLIVFWYLLCRQSINAKRNRVYVFVQFSVQMLLAMAIAASFDGWGKSGGCLPPLPSNRSLTIAELVPLEQHLSREKRFLQFNLSGIYFSLISIQYVAIICSALVWPLRDRLYCKERVNCWQPLFCDYLSQVMVDWALQAITICGQITLFYFYTDQPDDVGRFLLYLLVCQLMFTATQGHAFLVGTLFCRNLHAVMVVGPCTSAPFLLFTGLFTRLRHLSGALKPFHHISYTKYAFESLLVTIYGMDRCGKATGGQVLQALSGLIQQLTSAFKCGLQMISSSPSTPSLIELSLASNKSFDAQAGELTGSVFSALGPLEIHPEDQITSMVMKEFDITEDKLWIGVLALIGYSVLFHSLAYLWLRLRKKCL